MRSTYLQRLKLFEGRAESSGHVVRWKTFFSSMYCSLLREGHKRSPCALWTERSGATCILPHENLIPSLSKRCAARETHKMIDRYFKAGRRAQSRGHGTTRMPFFFSSICYVCSILRRGHSVSFGWFGEWSGCGTCCTCNVFASFWENGLVWSTSME